MKECWINVYQCGSKQWQGFCYPKEYNEIISKINLIYRIHVRLK